MRRLLVSRSNRALWLMLIHTAIFNLGVFGITDVILNFYFVSLGHQADTIGLLQGLGRVGGTLTGVPLGLVADRIGPRRLIVLCMVGVVGSYIPLIFFPTLPILILSRFAFGAAFGAVFAASGPLMVQLSPSDQRTRAFALLQTVGITSTAVGSAVGGLLPAAVVGLFPALTAQLIESKIPPAESAPAYGATLLGAGLLCALSVVPLLLFGDPPASRPTGRPALHPLRHLRQNLGRMVYLSSPMFIFGLTAGLAFPFYNLFFRTQFSQPDAAVGTIMGISLFIMGVSTGMAPAWERRLGRVGACLAAMFAAGLGYLVMGLAMTLWLGILSFIAAISVRNLLVPLYQPLYIESFDSAQYNVASGVNSAIWNIGWFLASTFGGKLLATAGFGVLYLLIAVGVCITGAAIYFIFRRNVPHTPEAVIEPAVVA